MHLDGRSRGRRGTSAAARSRAARTRSSARTTSASGRTSSPRRTLAMWKHVPTNKKVGVMWPNDADGNAIRAALGPLLEKAGYTIVDPGAYEDGTNDYSPRSRSSRRRTARSSTRSRSRPTSRRSGSRRRSRATRRWSRSPRSPRPGCSRRRSRRSGSLGYNLASGVYWHPTFPYKSRLTGMTSKQLAAGYTKATKKQWNQQLGATMALFDVGVAALKAERQPEEQGGRRACAEPAQHAHDRRARRLHERAGAARRDDADHRRPVGQGEEGHVQARLRHRRERGRQEGPVGAKLKPYSA